MKNVMTRLIDADELMKQLKFNSWDIDEWELPAALVGAGMLANTMAIEALEKMPAVEHIQCKNCRHFAGEGMYCAQDFVVQFDHFYCYHAERKAE